MVSKISLLFFLIIVISACQNKQVKEKTVVDTVKPAIIPKDTIDGSLDSLAAKMVASKGNYTDDGQPSAEELFVSRLLIVLKKPESFTANYSSLEKYDIKILTSDDKLLRIFYWLSPNSGTMWHVQNILQYQTSKDTLATASFDSLYEQREYDGSPTPFFESIYALKPAKDPTYLLLGNGQMSGMEPYSLCRSLTLLEGKFSIDAKIFKVGKSLESELFTSASLMDEDNPDEIRRLIQPKFNAETKTLTYGESKNTKEGFIFTGKRKSLVYRDGSFQ
ncbi:hypothetical protein [Pedobacter duraquae]|uniref:Lipoprotein n=1 Tax=Pedobacter duraquae TaxID=425511 RepID=A0A4V3C3M8_9SPHI|nr:hypothetical protein [Pedobacter duraquae]TDO22698.1 hypothetical protein CLV32_1679 [Pedobacter duraquae]